MNLERFRERHKALFLYVHEAFQALLVAYLVLLLANQFGSFVYKLYLNWLLGLVIVLGVVSVLFFNPEKKHEVLTRLDQVFIWALGVLGVVLIYIKTQDLGWLAYVISILSGALIVLLGYLVYEEEDEGEEVLFNITPSMMKRWILIGIFVLVLLSVVLGFFIGFLSSFRIIFGSVFVLLVPGAFLSYAFFPAREIDVLERVALSFALSIAVVPLLVFYLNLLGMKITALSVSLVVVGICILTGVYLKKRATVKEKMTGGWRRRG
jgi:hypothetical protein